MPGILDRRVLDIFLDGSVLLHGLHLVFFMAWLVAIHKVRSTFLEGLGPWFATLLASLVLAVLGLLEVEP